MEIMVRDPRTAEWKRTPDLSDFPPDKRAPLLWADVDLTDANERELALVGEELGLHPLAVEDALNPRQRPKLEAYPDHLFLVVHELNVREGQLEASQIACFIGENYVLTVHDAADRLLEVARRRWDRECGVDIDAHVSYLVYVLLDTMVDDYQSIADGLEDATEQLEEIVLELPTAPVQRQIYEVKQQVSRLRRYSLPLARTLDYVLGGNTGEFFPETTHQQLRDVNDHLLRIADQIRSIDDLTNAALEVNRHAQADSLSQINKQLSGWAAIFGVATIIAGIYGMNYALVPTTRGVTGFWFAIGEMIVACTAHYFYFRRKGWL
ncbi:MAG TPA: magnesium transporter CorA family protein [Actinomycetota bacterium]|jgi:magnesium transporter